MKAAETNGTAKSLRALGRAVGRSAPTILAWTRRTDWPFATKPPWDVEEVRRWMQTLEPEPGSEEREPGGNAPQLPEAKLRLVLKRVERLELENEQLKGNSLSRDEVERGRVERIQAVRNELGNIRLLALKLPLAPADVPKAELILEEWGRAVCRKFERGS